MSAPDQRERTDEGWKDYVAGCLRMHSDRMDKLEEMIRNNHVEVVENTALTRQIQGNTDEFLKIFKAGQGGLQVLGWFGTACKWVAAVAAAIVILAKACGWKWPH